MSLLALQDPISGSSADACFRKYLIKRKSIAQSGGHLSGWISCLPAGRNANSTAAPISGQFQFQDTIESRPIIEIRPR